MVFFMKMIRRLYFVFLDPCLGGGYGDEQQGVHIISCYVIPDTEKLLFSSSAHHATPYTGKYT